MVAFYTLALLSIAHLTTAAPSPPSAPFQVTNLGTFEPSGRPNQQNIYRVGFNVTDPSDGSSTGCEAKWDFSVASSGYPKEYMACVDPAYAFKFENYQTYYDFTLDVKHTTTKKHDKKKTVRKAKGLVDLNIIQCAHAASGFSTCHQRDGIAFPLPVYDVKRY